MSVYSNDTLALADELVTRPDEASARASVSRAYYALFCAARDSFGLKGHAVRGVNRLVIERYMNSGKPDEREVGRILDKLRRFKSLADLESGKALKPGIAERSVLLCRRALELLEGV